MTKRAAIIAMWDKGARDCRAIASAVGSTPAGVKTTLSVAGRLAGRMSNGPAPTKTPLIQRMWLDGERDLDVISRRVQSNPFSVRRILNKLGYSYASHDHRFSGENCRLPLSMIEWARAKERDPIALAEKLLVLIADEDMYNAVLDE